MPNGITINCSLINRILTVRRYITRLAAAFRRMNCPPMGTMIQAPTS
jgi:hypothetical protein